MFSQIPLSRSHVFTSTMLLAAFLPVGSMRAAQPDEGPEPSAALKQRVQPLLDRHQGEAAVFIKHLPSGQTFTHRATEPMPTASLIKFPILIEAYRQAGAGKWKLDDPVTLREEDKVPGSGLLTTHFSAGLTMTQRDALRLMIAFSDNTATNLVLDRIGLPATSRCMVELQCPHTQLHAKVFRADSSIAPERSKQFGLGSTTAAEIGGLFEKLHRRELPGLSVPLCDEMLEHLRRCDDKTMLRRHIPDTVKIAHKTGAVSASRCDAGLIEAKSGTIVVCVLTTANKDQSWSDSAAPATLIAEIGRQAFEHFERSVTTDELDDSLPDDTLRSGASGDLVAALQRTLNARLSPGLDLTVDGEFGPATEKAVKAFQRDRSLKADGVVREDTWKALSPILTDDALASEDPTEKPSSATAATTSTPPPVGTNPKRPGDDLTGPPFVTAEAWAVGLPGDGKGKVLSENNADKPLETASTTKIMTALVVLELAREKPAVLDELVTISRRADGVEGSAASLRAGEKLRVRDLLFGLLLPSGNDAALALAEAFGPRVAATGQDGKAAKKTDPATLFVIRMNELARKLGMSKTTYRNPHGLPQAGHVSSARDLVTVTTAALQHPLFRDIIGTSKRELRVASASGYSRDVTWKNSNKLLDIEGWNGVKTGWTNDAGSCLVALARRGEDEVIVVVLGSSTSTARYVDAQNLGRWAWQLRARRE